MAMARTDGDSWDITESVGATALGVAMARAAESDCGCPLFTDPYAQLFVDAATARGWDSSEVSGHLPLVQGYAAARTKWFDEYFIAAGANGIDQAVILAAGLDARAWRLPWVSSSVVYEIDQPQVLAFKAETLEARGARPAVAYRPVPIDLRADWPTALQEAVFDPVDSHRVVRRGTAALPAGRRPGCFVRQDSGAQRHRQSDRRRSVGPERLRPRTTSSEVESSWARAGWTSLRGCSPNNALIFDSG